MKHRHIVVEGPIGCGKTSLAHTLAERLGATPLLEDPKANPFLPHFYRDMRALRAADAALLPLPARAAARGAAASPTSSASPTVADFTLAKDPLFARLTLDDAEYQLYSSIYEHVKPQAPVPDLVIYLQASIETLLARVKKRGDRHRGARSREDYLRRLSEAYTRYFHDYTDSPLLIVNSERLNFVDCAEHLDLLVAAHGAPCAAGASSSTVA